MTKQGRPRTAEWTRQKCAQCGTEFECPSWEPKKFCSRSCYYAFKKGKPQPNLLRREIKTCPRCGTEFEVGGLAGKRKQIYCSVKCAGTSKYPPAAELSVADAAYLAGFFDGEGNIQETKPRTWRIKIYQSDESVIRWIAEVTGTGFVSSRMPGSSNLVKQPEFRLAWYWQLYGRNAALFLTQLLPYMHVKRALAEKMIADYDLTEEVPPTAQVTIGPKVHV